jgi:hypothetical protein
MVLLGTPNVNPSRPTKKFDQKYLGPFRVEEVVNPVSYRLKQPHELQLIHDTFHTNLLRPTPQDPLPGQFINPRRHLSPSMHKVRCCMPLKRFSNPREPKRKAFSTSLMEGIRQTELGATL